MITSRPTDEQFSEWLKIWQEYAPVLKPNRRSGIEVARYIMKKYKAKEYEDAINAEAFARSVMFNSHMREKLPEDSEPDPKFFSIPNEGAGAKLYEDRSEVFSEVSVITVCIDTASGCYTVEGSEDLWDELCAYQGLDAMDLDNPVCVAQYIEALKKEGKPLPRK